MSVLKFDSTFSNPKAVRAIDTNDVISRMYYLATNEYIAC